MPYGATIDPKTAAIETTFQMLLDLEQQVHEMRRLLRVHLQVFRATYATELEEIESQREESGDVPY